MVDIVISDSRQRILREKYYSLLINWIDSKKMWTKLGNRGANQMMKYIHDNSRVFFLASVEDLLSRSQDFDSKFSVEKYEFNRTKKDKQGSTAYGRFMGRMRTIYKSFMQDSDGNEKYGFWLMKELGLKVCPYCNRNYTLTIDEGDIHVRPEFDHFYPESLFPSLILSFYNYVPSCPQCNRLKKTEVIDVNPWLGYPLGKRPKFRVDTSTGEFPAHPRLLIEGDNSNTQKLGIKELYNENADYVKDILDRIQAYNPATLHAIKEDFQGIVHTEGDLARIVWGNYIAEKEVGKRPMSKLTADILEQYKKYL